MQMQHYIDKVRKIVQKIPISGRDPLRYLKVAMNKWDGKMARPVLEFREITLAETDKLITSLSSSKSFGHDTIDAQGIKDAAPQLLRPIQFLINFSLKNGKFARKWKFSRITPMLKSRECDRMDVSSYRPVSVLPSISKMVERSAQQQILKFLEQTKQLNASNHAYRTNLSTTTTLAEILDQTYENTESRKISNIMAIDSSAAFDCVNHEILLEKMEVYNIGEGVRNWTRQYLEQRTQYVVLGKDESRMSSVTRGVPQGSVIGPLIYAIFTNVTSEIAKKQDCRNQSHNSTENLFGKQCDICGIITLYADDSTYVTGSRKRENNLANLNRVLENMKEFLDDNQLAINMGKTSLIEQMVSQKKAKTRGEPPHLTVDTENGGRKVIRSSTQTRILGANLQENMTWQSHLETGPKAILPQMRKTLGMLRHLGRKIPIDSRRNLARGLIISRLNYIMPLWGGTDKTTLRKVQVLLNSTARWVLKASKRIKIRELMRQTGWYTVTEQMKIATAMMTWKIVHLRQPRRLRDRMETTDDYKIVMTVPRLRFSENCFRWRAANIWNDLPLEMRMETSIARFKGQMRRLVTDERDWPPD